MQASKEGLCLNTCPFHKCEGPTTARLASLLPTRQRPQSYLPGFAHPPPPSCQPPPSPQHLAKFTPLKSGLTLHSKKQS